MILEILRVPPSPNYMLRAGWRSRHAQQKTWDLEIFVAAHQSGQKPTKPYPRAKVTIDRRSSGNSLLDPDNLVASIKPVLDALRHTHILEDDSPAHIELSVTQSRGKPAMTRIEIQPLV